jgi:hypothetical protein
LNALVALLREDIVGAAGKTLRPLSRLPQQDLDLSQTANAEEANDGIEILGSTHYALQPFVATDVTVDPDALFVPQQSHTVSSAEPSDVAFDPHERNRLRQELKRKAGEVGRVFHIEMRDVWWYWAKLRGSVERADETELRRRITAMDNWLKKGSHPVHPKRR